MKKRYSGIVHNISTNPFQAFSSKRLASSTFLSLDISFDLCDDDGRMTRVWFYRSFRMPPPLEDGDFVQVKGHYGRLLGFIGRRNLYASRIVDRRRNREYTAWRNKVLFAEPEEEKADNYSAPAGQALRRARV